MLCDYSCGMIVAQAETKEEAIELAEDNIGYALQSDLSSIEPTILEEQDTKLDYVYGGG